MKKLMGLLFEEEEVIEEEEIFEAPTRLPLKKEVRKTQVVKEQPRQQVSFEKVQTSQQSVRQQSQATRPTQQTQQKPRTLLSSEASADGLQIPRATKVVEEEPKPEVKKISMSVEDIVEAKPVQKRTEVVTQVVQKKKNVSTGYEFTPVISPMFGVDEKDTEAIVSVPQKKKGNESKIGTVISPMYGFDKTAEPDAVKLEKSTAQTKKKAEQDAKVEKDTITLTLDDILARTAALTGKTPVHQEEVIQEKKVINSRNMSLFDDDSE